MGVSGVSVIMDLNNNELNSLFAYGMTLTGNRDQALELVQACLARYLERVPDADTVQQPLAYVRRMMRNQFLDDQRWRSRRVEEEFDDAVHSPGIEQDLEALLVDEIAVESVWRKMNAAEREVVHFWAIEGMSAAEIALHLGIPRNTVLSRLHRVRLRLAYLQEKTGNQHRG